MANDTKFDEIDGSGGTLKIRLDTTATGASAIRLGTPTGQSGPGTWHVTVTGAGSIGTWLPKVTLRGSELTGASAGTVEFVSLADTTTLLTTAQGAGNYLIAADEWDIWIDYTAGTAPMTIYARPGRQ